MPQKAFTSPAGPTASLPDPDASAPGELYRDPVYDSPTDPTVVRDGDGWWMFYTQRRATHPDPGPEVAWIHGTRVGVARSDDGLRWSYAGTLEPSAEGLALDPAGPPAEVTETHWAPDVVHDGQRWRMYLTQIAGVPHQWPGHPRHIVEYVSDDLSSWTRRGPIALDSDRVIDACVAHCPDGRWRLWYKDEAAGSVTKVAVSTDLERWDAAGTAIGGRPHEGPYVFELGGVWWMITDEWRGMAVYRSADAVTWERQGGADETILGGHGEPGVEVGRHGMVVVEGDSPVRGARLYYFTHPWWDGSDVAHANDDAQRRCRVHVAMLRVERGVLVCER